MARETPEIQLVAGKLDDAERITRLINRSEDFDGVPRVLTDSELLEDLQQPSIDLGRDYRLALLGGELVGWVLVDHTPVGQRQEKAFIHGGVDPHHRGIGVGRALMTWGVDLARRRLLEIDNDLPKYVRVYGYEQIEGLHRLLSRMEFTPVRYFEELLMPLAERAPIADPTGVTIISWPVARNDEIRRVKNTAFEDHWGSTPSSPQDWSSFTDRFGTRIDLSFAAVDDATGDLVGHCLNSHYPEDEALLQRRDGWIDSLGTLRDWRGRGVASSMIAHSLDAFADVGFTHASIEVDSANPTGASRLYRSIGFRPQHRVVASELRVA